MSWIRRACAPLCAALLWSCADTISVENESALWSSEDLPASIDILETLPAVCGDPTITPLIADETVPVGTVGVVQDGTNLYVVYQTDSEWPIHQTALFVGSSASDIPTSGGGNPRVGKFPYLASHAGTNEVVWEVPLESLTLPDVVVAAFAEVGAKREGAWGEGEMISPGGNWSMRFAHEVAGCVSQTVGPAGGTLTTPDGNAILVIPPGALSVPVAITVQPSSVEDLPAHFPPDVIPVEGTIWKLGPDGLQFSTPAAATLHYTESNLPPGVAEEELEAFIINGIFDVLGSSIDTEANTATAEVEHFSRIGLGRGSQARDVDLEVSDPITPSTPTPGTLDFTTTVRNTGPDASRGGTVVYEARGNVALGGVPNRCSVVPSPNFGDVAIACPVGRLNAGASREIDPFQVTVPDGTVTVRASVFPEDGDTDLNPHNDQGQTVFATGPGDVDLNVGPLHLFPGSQPVVGGSMEIGTSVDNRGSAASNQATLRIDVFGGVVLTDNGGCLVIPNPEPAAVALECAVAPLAALDIVGIPPFTVMVQSAGDVTVRAVAIPALGDTDAAPANNKEARTIPDIGSSSLVDLEPFNVFVTDVGAVGSPTVVHASAFNWGPHPSTGGTMVYHADGPVSPGTVAEGCVEILDPPVGIEVAVECPIPLLGVRQGAEIADFQFVRASEGTITVRATTRAAPEDTDVDPTNDQEQLVFFPPPPPR